MRLTLAFAAIALLSTAATAREGNGLHTGKAPHQRGCTVQQVHTPAGKIVHSAPIVTCPTAQTLAKADVSPAAAKTARD